MIELVVVLSALLAFSALLNVLLWRAHAELVRVRNGLLDEVRRLTRQVVDLRAEIDCREATNRHLWATRRKVANRSN